MSVKEQRVNGSWCGINMPHLRCTLTGFERNYPVKILSNQINQKRCYSIESDLIINTSKSLLTEPWFISGFTNGEECFLIVVRIIPINILGWQIEIRYEKVDI